MDVMLMNAPTQHTSQDVTLRPAMPSDFAAIYDLFQHILREGATYSYSPEEMTKERSLQYWMEAPGTHCYVAESGGAFAGVFAVRPNRTGRAGHVANASFIVHPDHRGKGVGRALGLRAIELAKSLGYQAIQYNFVVSANEVAVKLWKSLGYNIVGTLPKGHQHPTKGLVDVYIMHRYL
jgi:L-amino acid N-acyltransferase YncA